MHGPCSGHHIYPPHCLVTFVKAPLETKWQRRAVHTSSDPHVYPLFVTFSLLADRWFVTGLEIWSAVNLGLSICLLMHELWGCWFCQAPLLNGWVGWDPFSLSHSTPPLSKGSHRFILGQLFAMTLWKLYPCLCITPNQQLTRSRGLRTGRLSSWTLQHHLNCHFFDNEEVPQNNKPPTDLYQEQAHNNKKSNKFKHKTIREQQGFKISLWPHIDSHAEYFKSVCDCSVIRHEVYEH